MRRALVTGASGFIGRHTLPHLARAGWEIHAALPADEDAPTVEASVQWHVCDLLRAAEVSRLLEETSPSHLLHMAWNVEPDKYMMSLENLRWVQASLDVLQSFTRAGGKRVVMAGTCFEYDLRGDLCSESRTPTKPTTVYGVCKHALQVMVQAFADQSGLSAAWGRIFYLHGPHEHPRRLVPTVISSLLRGEEARCSHGNQVRDFSHAQDVAGAFATLLNSDVRGPVNIGSGQPVTLRDLIFKIAALLGREDLVRMGAIPAPSDDPPAVVADVTRLREEVGWQPTLSLEEGLAQTIRWWEARLRRNGDG